MKICDIIFCALGFYCLGFFITSSLWALFRVLAKRPRTETYWKKLYFLSCFSWMAVLAFILIGFEIVVVGIGAVIEEKIKRPEEAPEDVNQKVKEM